MPPSPPLTRVCTPPPVRVGDYIRCVYRRRWCRVTGWTAGPLRWPVGHPLKGSGGGGILVTSELVRAIRTESFEALTGALGVSRGTVQSWRGGV
ncbi:MAG TPA: hypothetical protein VKE74_20175, partial [Gemmataceae bacterium]|nr:hypothetical protein [Gemmataceae bacterium]